MDQSQSYSGIYFIPTANNTLESSLANVSTLSTSLESLFPTATRLPPWSLTYRLFRDTLPPGYANSASGDKPFAHGYTHVLQHSALDPGRGWVYVQPSAPVSQANGNGSGANNGVLGPVTGIPARQQDTYVHQLLHQGAALWDRRHVLGVVNGVAFEGGAVRVLVGELRSQREGTGSVGSGGVVCCISTGAGSSSSNSTSNPRGASEGAQNGDGSEGQTNGNTEKIDIEFAKAVIGDIWGKIKAGRDLGKGEVRETWMAGEEMDASAAVRMWCEVLKLRG